METKSPEKAFSEKKEKKREKGLLAEEKERKGKERKRGALQKKKGGSERAEKGRTDTRLGVRCLC